MKLEAKTLSPIHIGVGDEGRLTPFDYMHHNGKIVVFNLNAFFSENPSRAEEFHEQVNKLGRDFSLSAFLNEDEISQDRYHLYPIKLSGETPKEIHPVIKTPLNRAYLPGSSIKGSIRTALAYYALSNANSTMWRELKNGKRGTDIKGVNNEKNHKKVGKEIEKVVFGCGLKKRNGEIKYEDPKYDILKFIRVTDSSSLPKGEERIEMNFVDTFSQMKDKSLVSKNYNSPKETISPDSELGFSIDVDKNFLAKAHEIENSQRWIGLKQKLNQLFGINPGIDDVEEAESKIYSTIEKACNLHSKDIINRDLGMISSKPTYLHRACGSSVADDFRNKNKKWCHRCQMGNLGSDDLVKINFDRVKEYLEGLKKSSEEGFLIHLGFGVGWHSTTIGMALDERFLQKVRKDFNLGKTFIKEFPKTRRFVVENGAPKYSLGWIKATWSE